MESVEIIEYLLMNFLDLLIIMEKKGEKHLKDKLLNGNLFYCS